MLWMDPGEPAAAEHTLAVVADVLRRYDVDGVHIDDYFYPYPVPPTRPPRAGARAALPRRRLLAALPPGGGTLARDDWRRATSTAWCRRCTHGARASAGHALRHQPLRPGRPDRRPPGITGFSQYDKLYADVERWLEQGWLDYLVPQLYWPIDRAGPAVPGAAGLLARAAQLARAAAPPLAGPVHQPGAPQRPAAAGPREIVDQVSSGPGAAAGGHGGHIHFSMVALMQDRDGLATRCAPPLRRAGAGAGHALARRPRARAPALRRRGAAMLHVGPPTPTCPCMPAGRVAPRAAAAGSFARAAGAETRCAGAGRAPTRVRGAVAISRTGVRPAPPRCA
jgi:hypothetical protein